MSTKKFDLEKALGNKINGQRGGASVPVRFAGGEVIDRREQRKRDQALGLTPFACKLPATLVEQLRDLGVNHGQGINGVVAELLTKGLTVQTGDKAE